LGNTGSKSGAAAENRVENLKRIIVGIASRHSQMAQIDVELVGRHADEFRSLACLANGLWIRRKTKRFGRPGFQYVLDLWKDFGDSKIAHHGQKNVVGSEIFFVKIYEIGAFEPLNGLRVSVRRAV